MRSQRGLWELGKTKTALELGASGNKFLNVQNEGGTEGSFKVVKV